MNTERFSEAMGELDSRFVEMSANYRPKQKRRGLVKWASMAACLCLILTLALSFPYINNPGVDPTEPTDTRSQTEQLKSRIAQWQAEGYKGIVVDTEDNSVYPLDAEIVPLLGERTEIVLSNGIDVITIVYTPQETPDAE